MRGEDPVSKKCINCGAELADSASFCPHCETDQGKRQTVRQPRLWRKKLFVSVVVIVVLAAAAQAAALIYSRTRGPMTYEGGAQVKYTDRDGTYSLQLSFDHSKTVAREAQDGAVATAGINDLFAMPSQLTIYDEKTDADTQDVFFEKVESCTAETIPEEGSRAMTVTPEPAADPVFPDAARVAHVNYSGDCGTNEIRWTIRMKNGDTIILKQTLSVTLLATVEYSPENAQMDTLEELKALLKQIGAEVSSDTIVDIYLPPVTYDGSVDISGRTVNLYGGTDGDNRTTFTRTLTMRDMPSTATITGIDFTGTGGTGIRSTVTIEVRECTFSGWDIGIEAAAGAWVTPIKCMFSGNDIGFQFNSSTCQGRNHTFFGNIFTENGTAVLLSRIPGNSLIYFTNCQFSRNETDIDNRTQAPIDIDSAIFG